ncbi:MAG: prepilin-type N-terminal cleavage/methylation domain-containing protein [Gemmatimonas sp.]
MPQRSVLPVRRLPVRRTRRGVTLVELLVVLVLMAIGSALIVPALRLPDTESAEGPVANGLMPSPEVDGVIATARKLALDRGEPLRLRMAADGVWGIVSARNGAAIASGRSEAHPSWAPDMTIDATGTCILGERATLRAGARAWDGLACRWRSTTPVLAGTGAP